VRCARLIRRLGRVLHETQLSQSLDVGSRTGSTQPTDYPNRSARQPDRSISASREAQDPRISSSRRQERRNHGSRSCASSKRTQRLRGFSES
jgi:hypothetical protein